MKEKSIKLNFIMNAILSMSSLIFPLITFPYVSRILLPVGNGKVSFATSVVSYFALFAGLGIPTYGIRACAAVRDDKNKLTKTAQELLIINLVMTAIMYVLFFMALLLVPRMRGEKALFIVLSTTILLGTLGVEWLYKALEEYTYITVRSIIFKLVALIATFVFIHKQEDYIIYGAISILAASASNVLNFINAHKYISLKPCGDYEFKKHFKPIGTFFAMTCSITVYTNLDNVMLGFIKGDDDVGFYGAAVKVKGILVSLITSLGTVLLPRASYFLEHGMKKDFERVAQKALNFVVVAALPLMVYFMIYARESILLLSGKEFVNSIPSMIIIMPTIFFIGLTNILGMQILVPTNREKQVLYSTVCGAVVDLVINIMLIPKMASAGAAIGTLVAELAVLIYQYAVLRREVKPMFKVIKYGVIALGLLVGGLAAFAFKYVKMHVLLTLVCSATVFFSIYVVILLIFRENMAVDIIGQFKNKIFKKSGKSFK